MRAIAPNRHQGSGSTRPKKPRKPVILGTSRPAGAGISNPAPAAPKPGLGAPAPSAPAAPAAPVGKHFVPDAEYNTEVDTAGRASEYKLGSLNTTERRLKFDFGIDDPTNPNSRMLGLKRAWLAKTRGDSVSIAGRGDLYSGSHERAMARDLRGENAANAQLRSQYETGLQSIKDARAQVGFDTETAKGTAFQNWLIRHQNDPGDVPPDAAPVPGPAAPGKAKPKAKPKSKPKARPKPHGTAGKGSAPNRRQGSGNLNRPRKRR